MRDQLKKRTKVFGAAVLVGAALAAAVGCTSEDKRGERRTAPQDVEVAVVEQKDIPIEREWIGTLDGMVNAAIKAQVTGYLLTQNYTEGSFVRKGQLLFEIDPRPFQAAVDQAEGQLAQAKAQLAQAKAGLGAGAGAACRAPRRISAKRSSTWTGTLRWRKQQAITQQDLDNAMQNNQSHEGAGGGGEGAGGNRARRRLKRRGRGDSRRRPRWKRRR